MNDWKTEEEIMFLCSEIKLENIRKMRKSIEKSKEAYKRFFISEFQGKNLKWSKVLEGDWHGVKKGNDRFSQKWEFKNEDFLDKLWENAMYLDDYYIDGDSWDYTDNFMRDKFFEVYYLFEIIDWYGYQTAFDVSRPFAVLYSDYENGKICIKQINGRGLEIFIYRIYESRINWSQITHDNIHFNMIVLR